MPAAPQKYLKIAGAPANYSDAYAVTITKSTSAPAQCDFYIQLNYTATFPVVGQSVQWYRRDNTLVFGGVISKLDEVEMWEGGTEIILHVLAVGYDDRLFHRSTWNRNTFVTAQYRSYAGKVDTTSASHSVVTWVSNIVSSVETSNRFGPELAGKIIVVNGANRVVLSVDSPEQLTLTTNAGALSNVDYSFTIYSGDVVRDLVDGTAYPSGLLGGGFAEFEGFTWTSTSVQQGAAISNKGLIFDPPVSIHDAIQTLLDANPDFYFAVDDLQVVYFAVRTLVAAPGDFTPTSGKQKRNIKPSVTAEDVRNVEISITPFSAIDPVSDPFVGNSAIRSWFTALPMHEIVSVDLNGVPATFSDGSGTSTTDFYFQTDTMMFWQDHSAPVLTSGDTVTVTYRPLFADLIEYEDSAARAARAGVEGSGFGRYEQIIDRTNYSGKTDALAAAIAQVSRLKDNYYSPTIDTFETGYSIGQSFIITEPKLQLASLQLFIDEVSMTDQDTKGTPYDFEYTLKCISISRRITDIQVLRNAFSNGAGGGASGSVSSGGGGGGGGTGGVNVYLTDVTVTGTYTVSNPATPVDRDMWQVRLAQDGTGHHTIMWGAGTVGPLPDIGSGLNDDPLTMCVMTFFGSNGKWYLAGLPILNVTAA